MFFLITLTVLTTIMTLVSVAAEDYFATTVFTVLTLVGIAMLMTL